MIKTIAKVLQTKGTDVWSVAPDATIYEALEVMAGHGVGALLVMEDEKIVGVFSERDYARRVELEGLETRQTKVSKVMTDMVHHISPEKSVEEAMAVVTETRSRHLPVLDGDKLVGMVSIGDLVKASLAEKDFLINQLKSYIKGK